MKTRICCAIPSLQPGGMERVMSELINGFIRYHNVEVHVVLYGRSQTVFYDIDERAFIHKPNFKYEDFNRKIYTLKTMLFLRRSIKQIKPTSVLSFGSIWNSFVLLSCYGIGVPIYISDRGSPLNVVSHFQMILKKILYPTASGIIVQTKKAEEIYRQMYRQKNFKVIGNPIRNLTIPEQQVRDNIIVSVGRLVDTKNFDRLIRIFDTIGNAEWKLIIIGGNADKQHIMEALEKQRNLCKLKDNIILAGTRNDVDAFLLKSKIFAFTSTSEGFPNVVGEAMSAGLPVISYDCITGPSEMIVNGENGFLIDVFDDATYIEKLSYMMTQPQMSSKMGNAAKESIQRFDVKKIVRSFYDFLTEDC